MLPIGNFTATMARFLLLTLVFYLLYRLIFNMIIPIFRTTRSIRRQFEQMQSGGAQPGFQQTAEPREQPRKQTATAAQGGDYIDFEEVK